MQGIEFFNSKGKESDRKWLADEAASAKAALKENISAEQRERLEKTINAVNIASRRIRDRKKEYSLFDILQECYAKD